MGTCDPSGTGSFVTTDKGAVPTVARHDFGFRLTVPSGWLVEHSPKATMKGGQVFYSTPGGNALFVSFGNLTELVQEIQDFEWVSRRFDRETSGAGEYIRETGGLKRAHDTRTQSDPFQSPRDDRNRWDRRHLVA